MKSKRINKTRKKKNKVTKKRKKERKNKSKKIGAGPTQSTLADSSKGEPLPKKGKISDQSFSESLAEIDAEPTDDAIAPTTDHPPIQMPTPIPVDYDISLEDLLNSLELKGRTPANPSYKALGPYVKFIYAYFIRKYESPCFLFNDQPYKHRAVLNYNVITHKLDYPPSLGVQMRDCIRRGTPVIFITLYMKSEDRVIKHVNLIIYRPFKKVVEHYEPHGPEMGGYRQYYDGNDLKRNLRTLFEETLKPELEEYTPVFKPAHEICPSEGPQSIEDKINTDEDGYCQMWTMFLMETILMNPTLNTVDIIEECFRVGGSDPQYFKNLIRGYRQYIASELKTYLSKYVKYDIGTPEAIESMFSADYDELIEEMKQETTRRQLPPPPLQESVAYDVDRLTDDQIDLYINLLKTNTFGSSTSGEKDELVDLMTKQKLTMKTLIDFAYDTYFAQVSKREMNNIMFFMKFDVYPSSLLDLTYPDEKLEKTKQDIKEKYPEFHKFYFRLERDKQRQQQSIQKTTIEDVNGYDIYSLAEFYFFIQNHRPGTPEEITSDPIFTSLSNPDLHDEEIKKIITLLNQYQVTFGELFLWLKLFE
jgi:hypothetical protein